MRQLTIRIPQKRYAELLERYGSSKDVVNAISLRLEQVLTSERYLLSLRTPQMEMHATLDIPVSDYLFPLVNEFCLHRKLTQKEMFEKLIKKL